MAVSSARSSAATVLTAPAPSITSATALWPDISPTSWLKKPMLTPRSTTTWPSSGGSWPVTMRNSVVLPAPFGPTRPIFSPRCNAAEASMNRSCWPFCLLMLSRRIIGVRGLARFRRAYATAGAGRRAVPCAWQRAPVAHRGRRAGLAARRAKVVPCPPEEVPRHAP
jgi:hypothetical protein